MIHVFREKDFFLVLLSPCSWSVNQFPTRVLLLLFMDHIIIIIDKWRLHAIFSDPRVWINRGSTMDQHGSTWINRLQSAAARDSWLMRHASHASDSWLMRPASCVPRVRLHVHSVTAAPFSHRRPLSVMTTTKRRHFPMLLLLDLRLLSCTAWGNRVVLPHAISSTGAIVRIKTGRGAQGVPRPVVTHTKKAGIMPAQFLTCEAIR